MGNLLVTMIGIVFCAVLLVAGVSFIKPTAYIEHNQANNNSAQVEALVSDYNKLTVTTGHRPTVADYLTVYANGSTNVHYVNNAGTLMVASRIDGVQAGSGGANQWQFVSGCMGGTADCFCMPLSGASDVTYKATQISALQQMNTGTQSRLAISQTGCNDTAPNKNPTTWGANPSNYYLLVQLNGSGGTPPSASPYTCSAGSYSYTCPTTCGTATETPTPWVCNCSDGVTRGSSYCTPPAGPSCSDYTGCTYSYSGQTYGTCVASCGGGTCQAPLQSFTCTRSDGTSQPDSVCVTNGQSPPATQTYTNNTVCPVTYSAVNPVYACSTTCGSGTNNLVSYTCQGSNGTSANVVPPAVNSNCPTPPASSNGSCSAYTSCTVTGASYGACSCTGQQNLTSCTCSDGLSCGPTNASHCTAPPSTQGCSPNIAACTTTTPCSTTCGTGTTTTTTPICTGSGASTVCSTSSQTSSCSNYSTCTWIPIYGGTCSCDGTQSITYVCSGAVCNTPMPTQTSQSCTPPPSCTYTYTASCPVYGSCSTSCGNGTATLSSYNCLRSDGTTVDQSYCASSGTAPPATQACTSSASCGMGGGYYGENCHPSACAQGILVPSACTDLNGNPAPSDAWCFHFSENLACPELPAGCPYLTKKTYTPVNVQYGACSCPSGSQFGTQTATTWDCQQGDGIHAQPGDGTITSGPSNCSSYLSGSAYESTPATTQACTCAAAASCP